MQPTNASYVMRVVCRVLLAVTMLVVICSEPTLAKVSKKFLKGFLLGAYMAKHHEPIVIHMEKSKHG